MTLPNSGVMTSSMINQELGREENALFNLGGEYERALAGKPTGPISFNDFYGKIMREPFEGEYFEHYVFEWAHMSQSGSGHLIWNGVWITSNSHWMHNSPVYSHDGWLYHKGTALGYRSVYGYHVWHHFFSVWRERV